MTVINWQRGEFVFKTILLPAIVIIYCVGLLYTHDFSHWRATHWLFNYNFGFIKRGLPGSILNAVLDQPIYYWQIKTIAFMPTVLLGGMMVYGLGRLVFKTDFSVESVTITVLFLLSPFTLRYLVVDIGRFNILNFVIVTVVLLTIIRNRDSKLVVWLGYIASVLAIFIHEAFVLVTLPVLVSVSFFVYPHLWDIRSCVSWVRSNKWLIGSVCCLIMFASVFILTDGHADVPLPAYKSHLESITAFHIEPSSVEVLYRSFRDNVRLVSERLTKLGLFFQLLLLGSYLFFWSFWPLTIVCKIIKTQGGTVNFATVFFLGMPIVSPVLLIFLGVDWFRWGCYSIINAYVLYILLRGFRFSNVTEDLLSRDELTTFPGVLINVGCFITLILVIPSQGAPGITVLGELLQSLFI